MLPPAPRTGTVPNELWSLVLAELVKGDQITAETLWRARRRRPRFWGPPAALAVCRLVCRTFNEIALPFFYFCVSFTAKNQASSLKWVARTDLFTSFQRYRSLVKVLAFHIRAQLQNRYYQAIVKLFPKVPALGITFAEEYEEAFPAPLIALAPHLKSVLLVRPSLWDIRAQETTAFVNSLRSVEHAALELPIGDRKTILEPALLRMAPTLSSLTFLADLMFLDNGALAITHCASLRTLRLRESSPHAVGKCLAVFPHVEHLELDNISGGYPGDCLWPSMPNLNTLAISSLPKGLLSSPECDKLLASLHASPALINPATLALSLPTLTWTKLEKLLADQHWPFAPGSRLQRIFIDGPRGIGQGPDTALEALAERGVHLYWGFPRGCRLVDDNLNLGSDSEGETEFQWMVRTGAGLGSKNQA